MSPARCRCVSGEPSPGADAGRGEPSPGADEGRGEPIPGADASMGEPCAHHSYVTRCAVSQHRQQAGFVLQRVEQRCGRVGGRTRVLARCACCIPSAGFRVLHVAFCMLPVGFCVFPAACWVLHVACNVVHRACCVLRGGASLHRCGRRAGGPVPKLHMPCRYVALVCSSHCAAKPTNTRTNTHMHKQTNKHTQKRTDRPLPLRTVGRRSAARSHCVRRGLVPGDGRPRSMPARAAHVRAWGAATLRSRSALAGFVSSLRGGRVRCSTTRAGGSAVQVGPRQESGRAAARAGSCGR